MAEGASADLANSVLVAALQGTSFASTAAWMKFHVGPPGAAGTANPATETTRKNAFGMFGVAPTGGVIVNDATIGTWLSVAASENYTHFTIWSASTGGTFQFSGTITGGSVTIGDDVDIPPGSATVTFPVAT